MSETCRVVIVDDEPVARRTIRHLLRDHSEVEVVGEAGDTPTAVRTIEASKPDLLFLDIEMPGGDGFEVLERLTSPRPAVIFVTAFNEHAVRAFEVNALDYVLKPFDDERFHFAVKRARQRQDEVVSAARYRQLARELPGADDVPSSKGNAGHLSHLSVRLGNRLRSIPTDDIDWIEARDYYARLHVGGDTHLVRHTLTKLESLLDPSTFIRIHRSSIVRIPFIRELAGTGSGDLMAVLRNGLRLRVSRIRRDAVKRALRIATSG